MAKLSLELVKHETCLEYFRRRLSEGWKCVSLEGHNAVLLSPWGQRREFDLRNDVETLRPNAGGAETALRYWDGSDHDPDVLHNWEQVDEAEADGSSTYVFTTLTGPTRDLYNLPASSGSGVISKITVYFCCRRSAVDAFWDAAAVVKSDTTVTKGTDQTIVSHLAWNTLSQEWATNPADAGAWEWADIDALQIGVALTETGGVGEGYCTQVYVEVDYTPPSVPVADGDLIGIAIVKRS